MKKLVFILFAILLSCDNAGHRIEATKLGVGLRPGVKVTATSCIDITHGCESSYRCTVVYEDGTNVQLVCTDDGCSL